MGTLLTLKPGFMTMQNMVHDPKTMNVDCCVPDMPDMLRCRVAPEMGLVQPAGRPQLAGRLPATGADIWIRPLAGRGIFSVVEWDL